MIVCICRRVCDRTIQKAIDQGARSVSDVSNACRAGSGCGACHEQIESMIDAKIARSDEAHHCPREKLTVVSPYLTLAGDNA